MKEKIKALLENKEFAAKLAGCKDIAAAKVLFMESGVELTEDMLKQLAGGELSDDALAAVAGGWNWAKYWQVKGEMEKIKSGLK